MLTREAKRARARVGNWVWRGKLPRPDSLDCFICGSHAKEYHHFRGYRGHNASLVLPLCVTCHKRVDAGVFLYRTQEFMGRHRGHNVTVLPNGSNHCIDCRNRRARERYHERFAGTA